MPKITPKKPTPKPKVKAATKPSPPSLDPGYLAILKLKQAFGFDNSDLPEETVDLHAIHARMSVADRATFNRIVDTLIFARS